MTVDPFVKTIRKSFTIHFGWFPVWLALTNLHSFFRSLKLVKCYSYGETYFVPSRTVLFRYKQLTFVVVKTLATVNLLLVLRMSSILRLSVFVICKSFLESFDTRPKSSLPKFHDKHDLALLKSAWYELFYWCATF
jgi:hypothetical protein